jgi:hypothetical protein
MRVSSSSLPFTGTISDGTVTVDFRRRLDFFSVNTGPPRLTSARANKAAAALHSRVHHANMDGLLAAGRTR